MSRERHLAFISSTAFLPRIVVVSWWEIFALPSGIFLRLLIEFGAIFFSYYEEWLQPI